MPMASSTHTRPRRVPEPAIQSGESRPSGNYRIILTLSIASTVAQGTGFTVTSNRKTAGAVERTILQPFLMGTDEVIS